MRAFSVCFVLLLFVAMLLGASGNPVGEESDVALVAAEQPLSLFDVDAQQGHENEGDRLARQFGYGGYGRRGGYRGGYGGGYGYRRGYGGRRGGYGGRYYG
ncbi:neuropeptide-like protein 32 [Zeugodacus cucurbitae]|uniref:Uncharacterized protein n=1 Tax=Zeugodacus cucurbitae TaxID=28588 RepID=A0A0A1X2T6_ZEUCU|nr:neuropeptide-like protein 32 [Zeugodacus cucurbitae]